MDPLANLFYAELTGLPYADTDTSFTLTTGSVADLPDADTEGAYNLVIWDRAHGSPAEAMRAGGVVEIVRVTSDDGGTDTITVSRAQEGTTAQSYSSGNVYGVLLSPTKNLFDQLAPLTDANFNNMPTIAGDSIVAQGGNTDGEWVKYADGTMICFARVGPINWANGPIFQFSYPQSFTGITPRTCGGFVYTSSDSGRQSATVNTEVGGEQWGWRIMTTSTRNDNWQEFNLIAIGRWK